MIDDDINLAFTGVCVLAFMIALVFAFSWGDDWKANNPDKKPYVWGYFFTIGHLAAALGMAAVLVFFAVTDQLRAIEPALIAISFCLALATLALNALYRRKWAWILTTIFSLNPIFWVVNTFYIRKRWHEFSSGGISIPGFFDRQNYWHRALLVGSLFWIAIVVLTVLLFNPFNIPSYRFERNFWPGLKVALFPPIVAIAGYVLYERFVKEAPSSGAG